MARQNEPLLADHAVHVPVHADRSVLGDSRPLHGSVGAVHAHRQLYLWLPGMARSDLPDHHDHPHDVSFHIARKSKKNPKLTMSSTSAIYVQGRNAFNGNGQPAQLGAKAFAFMWTATVCLFLSGLLYCLGGAVGRKDGGYSGREHRRRGFFSSHRANSAGGQKNEATTYA